MAEGGKARAYTGLRRGIDLGHDHACALAASPARQHPAPVVHDHGIPVGLPAVGVLAALRRAARRAVFEPQIDFVEAVSPRSRVAE